MSFDRIQAALLDVQKKGQQAVDIEALLQFIASVKAETPTDAETKKLRQEAELATFKANNDRHLAEYRASVDSANEMFKSVIETAKTALTTSILINGGATVALLAFLGNLLAKVGNPPAQMQSNVVAALTTFALGVLLGGLATSFTYATQYCYAKEFERSGATFHILTVFLVLSTYIAFLVGVIICYHAFLL